MKSEIDYDKLVFLDAEALAEGGIREAYESLRPQLLPYVKEPATVEEDLDDDLPRYRVQCGGREFAIYEPGLDDSEERSWGRATHALFAIVNDQLAASDHRFYAINGGNDLGGLFMTTEQAQSAQETLPTKTDWPYLPTDEHPWYGQYH